MSGAKGSTRCAVIVGPQGGGKTTLLKALIERASGGKAPSFDTSQEAKDFSLTTEPNFARSDYLGDQWTFIDCPGSIELLQAGGSLPVQEPWASMENTGSW